MTSDKHYPIASGTLGAGRLKASDGPLPGPVDRVEHAYDEYGREVSCTVAGATWAKAFDVLGRLDAETDPLGLFDYSYDAE